MFTSYVHEPACVIVAHLDFYTILSDLADLVILCFSLSIIFYTYIDMSVLLIHIIN